jgi:hypothetical protein
MQPHPRWRRAGRLKSQVEDRRTTVATRRPWSPDTCRVSLGAVLVALVAGFAIHATCAADGIPEPDLIWYGRALNTSGGTPVRLTQGQLVWRIEALAGGQAVVVSTDLTNIIDQFSYVVRVPCETPVPGTTPNAATLNHTSPPTSYRRLSVTLDGQPLFFIGGATEFTLNPADRGKVERIDLQANLAPDDTDGDGMPNDWELQHFGSATGGDPNGDEDGDGLRNVDEYRAGTDPGDARSVLEIVEVTTDAGGVLVRWSSQAGQRYRVRRAQSLLTRLADYIVVQAAIAASPPINEFIDTSVGSGEQFFYLIELEP